MNTAINFVAVCGLSMIACILAAPAQSAAASGSDYEKPRTCEHGGTTYKANDTITDSAKEITYLCSALGNLRVIGCVHNGQQVKLDDMITKEGVKYQCVADDGGPAFRVFACVQESQGGAIDRRLGCSFADGEGSQKFEYECQYDASANSAKKVAKRCNYDQNGGVYQIDAGCYRKINNQTVGCVKQGEGKLSYVSDPAGLHEC